MCRSEVPDVTLYRWVTPGLPMDSDCRAVLAVRRPRDLPESGSVLQGLIRRLGHGVGLAKAERTQPSGLKAACPFCLTVEQLRA